MPVGLALQLAYQMTAKCQGITCKAESTSKAEPPLGSAFLHEAMQKQ